VTGIACLGTLGEFLMSVLEKCDPASQHFHKEVKDFFNCKSPEKKVDKTGPIIWLPR
jgi:hypothetical protein